jgi:hypothetical protein
MLKDHERAGIAWLEANGPLTLDLSNPNDGTVCAMIVMLEMADRGLVTCTRIDQHGAQFDLPPEDPFRTFTEWNSEADRRAFEQLAEQGP